MKVFLAGTNSEERNADVIRKADYLLESFYYIKPWQIPIIKKCKMFLLDSGAFTFFSSGKKIDWIEYIKKYANFINENDIKYFFELDIDALVGYSKVLEYRKLLESLTNKQCIPVWHKSRGKEEFVKMCKEYPYVAIGGLVNGTGEYARKYWKFFSWFVKTAHENNAQIHALGFTSIEGLKKFDFDSVDSTRWNCARFGRIEYFDKNTIKVIDKRKENKRICKSNAEVTKFTFQEWVKFQKYAEKNL